MQLPYNHKHCIHARTGDQEVKSLMVYCSTGCGWKGELGSLDNHKQKDCENSVVFCENNCGEINMIRKNLKANLGSECPNRLHKINARTVVQITSTKTTKFILNYIAPSDCILVFIVVKTAALMSVLLHIWRFVPR